MKTKQSNNQSKKSNESKELAERLHSLYKIYNSEEKLPEDLVSKLERLDPEVYVVIQTELERKAIYPLSPEEALKETKISFSEQLMLIGVLTLFGAGEYAQQKYKEEQKKEENSLRYLHLLTGGLKTFPSAVKEVFLTPKEEIAQDLMEMHNREAKVLFGAFRNNLEYSLRGNNEELK